MRFAHLSDTHLGHRQYGIFEREQDFYELFDKTIDKIIELDVDFVINSGDLFDYSRPSTDALLSFQKGLLKLNRAGIPVYAIAGNHDSILRKDVKPPLTLFRELGLNLITKEDKYYEFEDILICGAPYEPKSRKIELEECFAELSELSNKYSKSILVLHQGIKGLLPEHEIELSDLPDNFDYYALGHLHDYIRKECGRGCLVYPGSMELMSYSKNYEKYGKGFCVVDLSGDELKIDRISVEIERKLFFNDEIDYYKLEEELQKIKTDVLKLDKKPMIDITINGGDADSAEIYDILHNEFKDYVLNLKYNYLPERKGGDGLIDPGSLNARKRLREKVYEKYKDEKISALSVDLFEKLAVNEIEDAKIISNSYFKDHYGNFEEKKPINDTTYKEEQIIDDNSVEEKSVNGNLDDFF